MASAEGPRSGIQFVLNLESGLDLLLGDGIQVTHHLFELSPWCVKFQESAQRTLGRVKVTIWAKYLPLWVAWSKTQWTLATLFKSHGKDYCCSVTQLYLTLCDPMDCSTPGSSIHGIVYARILEWVAISSSRGSSLSSDWTCISNISFLAGRFFACWATREAPMYDIGSINSVRENVVCSINIFGYYYFLKKRSVSETGKQALGMLNVPPALNLSIDLNWWCKSNRKSVGEACGSSLDVHVI